jgi:hypothetical protein
MTPLAIVSDYLGLIAGLRARVAELDINYETLDQLAGWTNSYASKVLGEEPARFLGPMSFDAILPALGVKLHLVEDAEALARIKRSRYFQRREVAPSMLTVSKHGHVVRRITYEQMRHIWEKAADGRKKIPPRKRQRIARNAARARWHPPRL